MLEIIRQLLIVQNHDRKISELNKELHDIPARKELTNARLNDKRLGLQVAKDEIKRNTVSTKELEGKIEELKQKIIKLREQQFQIKTNEEYRALEKEIEFIKDGIRKEEDKEISLFEEMEGLKIVLGEREKDLKADETVINKETDALSDRVHEIEKRLAEEIALRTESTKGIDAGRLASYERILRNKSDFAIVPVENNNSCGGCHMNLPPQIINDAKKGQAVVTCNFCRRMLYYP